MQIEELLRLTNWFQENIVNKNIPTFYQSLYAKMNQNTRRNNNQAKQPFEIEKNNLINTLAQVNTDSLTLEQISFLKEIGILELFGNSGVKGIEKVLFENSLDIATATNKINHFKNKLNEGVTKLAELNTILSKSFTIDDSDYIPDNSVLMRVYFRKEVAIENIVDFKRLAATWHEIGRGIAIAQDKTPEDFRIIGAQKGSIIIEMAVLTSLATSVSIILLRGLKVAERVIEILTKAEELKTLKLTNKKIEAELKKEAEAEKKNGVQSILDSTVKELGMSQDNQGDKVSALKKAITKLIDFTQKGGAVDFIEPEIEGDKSIREEILQLRGNIEEIRELEGKIKLLESKIEK